MIFNKQMRQRFKRLSMISMVMILIVSSLALTPGKQQIAKAEPSIQVVVSQAGYSASDYKNALVVSDTVLTDTYYQIVSATNAVYSGTMTNEGYYWNKYVYSIDFSQITTPGTSYTVRSNGVSSYSFPIATNIWSNYRDEMTAFYRLLRSGVSTEAAYPAGYSSVAPSAKLYHGAGHLDDAKSADGTKHYDLTGSWYDAGDYGKYGGNQWVGAEIALAYVRYANQPAVQYDNDHNQIPDLIDEAIFGSDYLVKYADQLNGEMYNLKNNAAFIHPEKATDNIPNTADDRKLSDLSVGGSAKSAGTLAATARAIRIAIANGAIPASKQADMNTLSDKYEAAAIVFYNYVVAHPDGPIGSYSTRGGIPNSKLLADVELYLLTGDATYKNAASATIMGMDELDVTSTNYWDMSPLSMAELYPVADSATQTHIHDLLKAQVNYFLSSMDDTPYHVLNQFKNFGVNEPHASYLGDMMRYYELFGDQEVLDAVLKGTYWIFGENPWNISWVSGIGNDYVDFLHTRFDEQANTASGTGIVLPGAMVSGPNIKDTKDKNSVSPWYQDRSLFNDDTSQWRYNEFSISIQAGLLYTIMGLSATDRTPVHSSDAPVPFTIFSPTIGDRVRGEVTLFADTDPRLREAQYSPAGTANGFQAMTVQADVYKAVIDESNSVPYFNRRVDVRALDQQGNRTYSSTHYMVAPPLPDPSSPLLYDDFGGNGSWGGSSTNATWVNWYNQSRGTGSFSKVTVDGRTAGKFSHVPVTVDSAAKFQPWHDTVDLTGYQYLNVTLKNPGAPSVRTRIEISDNNKTYNLTGGWINVPQDWTKLQFNLNTLSPAIDKKNVKLAIWLKETTVTNGDMLVDEISASNIKRGSAPTLTKGTINQTSGDSDTPFTFDVTYTDVDNDPPLAVELLLDGVIHTMTATDSADTTYTDGKIYRYTIKLPPGQHSYYFHTTDTFTNAVSTPVQQQPSVNHP